MSNNNIEEGRLPLLVDGACAARLMGWSRGKWNMYHRRGAVPKPAMYRDPDLRKRPLWDREDIIGYSVDRILGVTTENGKLLPGYTSEVFRNTYGLHDGPIGAQLTAQGILNDEQGAWLDKQIGEEGEDA